MANGWTPERRARQAARIREWNPWEKSTGPRSAEGKARVARNAYRNGLRQDMRHLMREVKRVTRQHAVVMKLIRWIYQDASDD